jgi:hypothetical protein
LTNSKKKDPLQEVRNPVHNRIRYQKRLQEEREARKILRELDKHYRKDEEADDEPIQ